MVAQSERALCTRVVHRIFDHIEEQNIHALLSDLEELRDTFVYSDYSFHNQWQRAKPRLVRLLFHSLPFDEFLNFPAGRNFHKFETLVALDELADTIPLERLTALCEHFGFPGSHKDQHLFRRLCEAPDEAITLWLREWIEAHLRDKNELIENGVWTATQQIANAVRILANRRDRCAREACSRYAHDLPWGTLTRHPVTYALLDGLKTQDSPESRALLWDFVRHHNEPYALKRMGLSFLVKAESEEVLRLVLADLERAPNTEMREDILNWIDERAQFFTPIHTHLSPRLDTSHWSFLSRALLNQIWRQNFPEWPILVSDASSFTFLIRCFEHLRLKGFVFSLLVLMMGGQVYLWLLSRLVGRPSTKWLWLDALPYLSWIDLLLGFFLVLAVGGCARGPASNKETPRQKWTMAWTCFGTITLFLGGTVLVRLW